MDTGGMNTRGRGRYKTGSPASPLAEQVFIKPHAFVKGGGVSTGDGLVAAYTEGLLPLTPFYPRWGDFKKGPTHPAVTAMAADLFPGTTLAREMNGAPGRPVRHPP